MAVKKVSRDVTDLRRLNRATLARQHLLSRRGLSAIDMVERLAGVTPRIRSSPTSACGAV
ncbi:MAG: hypothetical protein WD208_12840 [Dehalococcoidia bacterium]